MRVLLVIAVALAALVVAAPAVAKESYCSPTGDYCTSVAKVKGVRYLQIATFSFTGRVKICVKDPTATRVCHTWKLQTVRSYKQVRVVWKAKYPNRGPGTYRVTFFYGKTSLGPALSFKQA